MANREKADLIIHPARLAILETLSSGPQTAQELSNVLPDISIPSLYRHLKLLLDAGMLTVSEIRPVRGMQEKVYKLATPPHMSQEELGGLSKKDQLHYFIMYLASHIQGFSNYLESRPEQFDMLADRVGYTEILFNASREDLDEFLKTLQPALQKLASQPPAESRSRRRLAIISYPHPTKESENVPRI